MTIIFDFNRTLYDPETGSLIPGVLELLQTLTVEDAVLHLISKLEPGREGTLANLGLLPFFTSTHFVFDKRDAIRRIVEDSEDTVYIVGDHLHGEIHIGNELGAKTIWVKRGKFSNLMPENKYDVPWRVAGDMKEVHKVLMGQE